MDWLAFPAAFLTAFVVSWGVNSLALRPWRRSVGLHWTERARRVHVARVCASGNIYYVPATLAFSAGIIWPESVPHIVMFALLGLCAAILATYPGVRETLPPVCFQDWTGKVLTAWFLHFGGLGMLVVAGLLMSRRFDWRALVIGLAMLGVLLWMHYGLAVTLMRRLRLLVPPPERLQRIVSETASRMNIAVRRVWLLRSVVSYAAALPSTGELIFSDRLLEALPDDQVAAVCAHELGHLSEDRAALRRRVGFSLTLFPLIFAKPFFSLSEAWLCLSLLFLAAWWTVMIINGRNLARKMEVRADAIGAENSHDATTYARALERIYEVNLIPAVMRGDRHAHPHLYDRMLAAGVTPAYERPAPPSILHWTHLIGLILMMVAMAICLAVNHVIG